MSKSFTARVRQGAAATVLAAAALPGGVDAQVQNSQINNYNPQLPTISVQELQRKMSAYEQGNSANSSAALKVATAGGNTNKSILPSSKDTATAAATAAAAAAAAKPDAKENDLRERIRKGDMKAIQEYAALVKQKQTQASGLPSTAGAAQQETATSYLTQQQALIAKSGGKPNLAAGVAQAMGIIQNPQGAIPGSESAAPFPVNYNEAQDAVRLINSKQAKSVTINGLQSDGRMFNVVDGYGPYASKCQPMDTVLKVTYNGTAGTDGSAPTYSQARNAPSTTVTEAAGQAKKGNFDQNPNGVQR